MTVDGLEKNQMGFISEEETWHFVKLSTLYRQISWKLVASCLQSVYVARISSLAKSFLWIDA